MAGYLNIADWQQVEQAVCSADIHSKRFKADEVEIVWNSDTYCFPIAQGDICLPGDSKESLIRRVGHEVYYKNKPKPSAKGESTTDEISAPDGEHQPAPAAPEEVRPEPPPSVEDNWIMQGDMLIRHHRQQRLQLFVPDDQNLPIPLKYIDVTRQTETSLESPSELSLIHI